MLCLGIESTAHTFGCGIVNSSPHSLGRSYIKNSDGKILANTKHVYSPGKGKGMIPREAAAHHSEWAAQVIEEALKEAKLKIWDVDLIAFSRGPGLPPCLRVGAAVARALSLKLDKPLIDVNHPVAHIEIGKLTTGARDPVILYASGGNTQILALVEGKYRIFGETLDIPVGNALDQFAREAGFGFPGGPVIEKLAKDGKYVELPYTVKGMDLSFSGLISEAVRKLKSGTKVEDLAFSLQETAFSMLVEVTERALAHVGKNEVLVVGGVAANRRFVQMLKIMCEERGAKAFAVPMEYANDNGAMIAWAGLLAYNSSPRPDTGDISKPIDPKWRVDEVDVTWA